MLNWNEIRSKAISFAREWEGESREMGEYQSFWDEFFNIFGVRRRTVARYQEKVNLIGERHRGFIDLFWPNTLIVEHKSRGEDLDSAYDQAGSYFDALAEEDRPRYIIVTDYARIRFYDLEAESGVYREEFKIHELPQKIRLFSFVPGFRARVYREENPINVRAVRAIGKLYEAVKETNYTTSAIDKLLTRLVFCFFADDTGIFNKDFFLNYIEEKTNRDGSDIGAHLSLVFQILNTPFDQRQTNLDEDLAALEYINGGLFAEALPTLFGSSSIRSAIISAMQFDWSVISPAVFGSMFQSVMDDKARHDLGAHYTSEKNILKVISGLFLDDLGKELRSAGSNKAKLNNLWNKISQITLLDPACGCGNFLVISYRELRRIELEIIKRLHKDAASKVDAGQNVLQMSVDLSELSKLSIERMYGIEIEPFPAQIAKLSLWLIDHMANVQLGDYFGQPFRKLPLTEQPNIVQDNALRINWDSIVQKDELSYILGNPPFISKQDRDDNQREDMRLIFGDLKSGGELDYVAAWYMRAANFAKDSNIAVAFVSTNSITQGEQAGILWEKLLNMGLKINFAHRTFRWTNEAPGKAAVHCVIIGFSFIEQEERHIFDYADLSGEPHSIIVNNINPYLVGAENILITSRRKPICDVPPAVFGSMPNDNGFLLFDNESEKNEFLQKEPSAEKFIKPLLSAKEYLNGGMRYCLWLKGATPDELRSLPGLFRRIDSVRSYRELSSREATRRLAQIPYLFGEDRQPQTNYVLIPRVSSERRKYVPLSFFSPDYIAGDTCIIVPSATLYHFGILQSVMHMAWMRTVCGRLKSDYRYSNELVYNNFPWPNDINKSQQKVVESAAQVILEVRKEFSNSTLADLYDPRAMPKGLLDAHHALDRGADACYGRRAFKTEAERLEFLFELYQNYTEKEAGSAKQNRSKKKISKL